MTAQDKINFLSSAGANIAKMAIAHDPHLRVLASELARDLAAWRAKYGDKDELEDGYEILRERAKASAERTKVRLEREGPKLWAEWHKRALNTPHPTDASEVPWMKAFMARLPCGECKTHFSALISEEFGGGYASLGDTYFARTVEIHNRVNTRLGKPTMSVDDARALYS